MAKKGIDVHKKMNVRFKDFLGDIPLYFQSEDNIFCFLALLLLNMPDEELKEDKERMPPFLFFIEAILMQTLNISEVANGNNSIRVSYDQLAELFTEPTVKDKP